MSAPTGTEGQTVLDRVLGWLRGGYPDGIPQHDYIALLGVLHRRLTRAEIEAIVAELAARVAPAGESAGGPATALGETEIRAMIASRVHETADPESVARVSARLAEGGWPLAALS